VCQSCGPESCLFSSDRFPRGLASPSDRGSRSEIPCSIEREQTVGAERSELPRNVESQRLATLEWATAERREAIADVRREWAASMAALRGERAVVVDDVRHIVDVVLLRVALCLVAAVVLAPLMAHAYARVWPRR
jgi:hypothetical protein